MLDKRYLDKAKASANREALVKLLYQRIFSWVVAKANGAIKDRSQEVGVNLGVGPDGKKLSAYQVHTRKRRSRLLSYCLSICFQVC